jgi:hypothetical protein
MEKPILFSGPMVRAILEGRKTQTRRVVKPQPWEDESGLDLQCLEYEPTIIIRGMEEPGIPVYGFSSLERGWVSPYGRPGDSLWVREAWNTWATLDHIAPRDLPRNTGIAYAADMENPKVEACGKIRPSMFMPRWVSRINLEVLKIRVERLQDISQDDAKAEGVSFDMGIKWQSKDDTTIGLFGELWDSINEARGFGWNANPWVWVVEFKRTK